MTVTTFTLTTVIRVPFCQDRSSWGRHHVGGEASEVSMVDDPTFGIGKICYVEMPAEDIHRSAEFDRKVFGWAIR